MRIANITLWAHELALAEPYAYGGGTLTHVTSLILRLTTETGLVGWGESCPLGPTYQPAHALGGIAAVQEMAPALIGNSVLPRPLNAKMDSLLEGHRYAKALFDIAAWDILGKASGQPLHTLLGGAHTELLPSYFAIKPLPPEDMAEAVKKQVAEGYTALQIKIGSGDLDADIASVRAAAEAAPAGVTIAADANRQLLVEEAVHVSNALRDLRLALEQPCNTPEEMQRLKGRLHHPLYWDESTTSPLKVMQALSHGYADGFGMKVTRVGGISAMQTVRDVALAHSARLSVDDSWGGDIIAAACVHLGATVPPKLFRGTWIAQPFIGAHYDKVSGPRVKAGHIKVPQGPGLGIAPDAAVFGASRLEFGHG